MQLFFYTVTDRTFLVTQRKSDSHKRLYGTVRPDRQPKRTTALDRLSVAPSAPTSLSPGAKIEWRPLAKAAVQIGVLTGADLRALALLSEVLATESELSALLRAEGVTIEGGAGRKAHPAVKLLESTRNQAARMLESFGLTPRGRQGVDVRPRSREKNPFAEFGTPDKYAGEPKPWQKPQ
jgi:P27 family predicted phage terminase small subunit